MFNKIMKIVLGLVSIGATTAITMPVVGHYYRLWMSRNSRAFIGRYDESQLNVAEISWEIDEPNTLVPDDTFTKDIKSSRVRKHRESYAFALATEAREKFGDRPQSEANRLITHKFIYDRLASIKDLRKNDRTVILFEAIQLSFLPTIAEINVKHRYEEVYSEQRMSALKKTPWWLLWLTPQWRQEVA